MLIEREKKMNNNFISVILIALIVAMIACLTMFGISAYNDVMEDLQKEEVATTSSSYSEIETKEDIVAPQVVEQPLDNIESAFSNVEYQSAASNTNYFYDQLESTAKAIYDGLEANRENMKSGTYTVEFGSSFSDILANSNGQQILGEHYQSAIEAFTYDNPEVFYLSPTKMYLNVQTTTKGNNKSYNVYIAPADGGNYFADGITSKSQIESYEAQIEQVKNEVVSSLSGSTYDKIKQIHDFLVDNISYDQTISKSNIYNLYGALVNKECVCEGYSKAFKYLASEAGIDCVIVVGTGTNSSGATENHSWNYVAINGNWYAVDATWDDPIVQGGGTLPSSYKYKYFLKGSNTMSADHAPSGQFTSGGKVFSYPSISSSDWN